MLSLSSRISCKLIGIVYEYEVIGLALTDTRFFTNEPENSLYERFAVILKNNTQFFDVLVGYFRSSGFFSMWRSLETVEKIRVLVGLNIDRYTVQILDSSKKEASFAAVSTTEGKTFISEDVEKEFETGAASAEIEKGVRVFIDWLKSGKLEMRMYTKSPIHAKVYVMRNGTGSPDVGRVITGSSNFSQAGLVNNLEFNVELKDNSDVRFAIEKFEALWKDAVDIHDTYIEAVEQHTWMRNDITPYQLYLKTLYEFFKEEINADKEMISDLLPEGYLRLQYQLDAVTQAKKRLEAYGGVFISDVVGLGKTYICAMLAKMHNRSMYKLIICPPVLVDYWRGVLQEFDVSRCDVVSLGKMDSIIQRGTDKYSLVFIDEAHRFRNSGTDSFTQLHQICLGKKVVLISATPINNYTSDIENQLYLFQEKQSGTIGGIKNLDGFFRGLQSKLNKTKKGSKEYMAQLRENSEVIRDKLLREIMIRRTRSEIQDYYEDDLKQQGLKFPKTGCPIKIAYEFDDDTDATFNATITGIKDFMYARYMPLTYLKDQKKYSTLIAGQRNMGGFMKGVLIKRLESSFYAFRMTLQRFIDSYERFISMYKAGDVYISKVVDVYDLMDDGRVERLWQLVEEQDVMHFKSSEFSQQFITDLRKDLSQLKTWQDMWDFIKDDPKLDEFRRQLTTNEVIKGHKVIVFTESMETAYYLYDNLKDIYGDRIVCFSGKSSASLKSAIEDSFNPKNASKENDKFDMLITTDILAEGINLHRANVIINYDLPWNPTRIMQRVGRINRVGSDFDRIYVFNFFPTAQSSHHMPLEDRILEKLQAFHDILGEDSKYLSDEENATPKKLFDDVSADLDINEESTNPELKYLAIIRKVRDDKTALFEKVKRLPRKARAGKYSIKTTSNATIGFIRQGALKTFFIDGDGANRQLTFMEAVSYIESAPDEPSVAIGHLFYDQYEHNNEAFDEMLTDNNAVSTEIAMVTGNDAKVIRILKAIRSDNRLTDDQEAQVQKLITLWENGAIPAKISKDVLKLTSADTLALYFDILKLVPEVYLEDRKKKQHAIEETKQVILSCYLEANEKL